MAIDPSFFTNPSSQTVSDKTARDLLQSINKFAPTGSFASGSQTIAGIASDQLLQGNNVLKNLIGTGVEKTEGLTKMLSGKVGTEDSGFKQALNERQTSDNVNNTSNPQKVVGQYSSSENPYIEVFPPDLNQDFSITFSFKRVEKRELAGKTRAIHNYTLVLPIPTNLVDTVNLQYRKFGYGPMAGLSLSGAMDAVNQIRTASSSSEARTAMNDIINRGFARDQMAAILYQYVIRPAMSVNQNIPYAAERAIGAVVNPNESQAFETVNLRSFNFSFRFAPKSEAESQQLRKIIQQIKARSLPSLGGPSPGLILGYPDEVSIEISPLGKSVFPFKKCFVQSVAINYGPEGPLFFNDDAKHPAVIDMAISVIEYEILTRNDVDKDLNEFPLNNEQPAAQPTQPPGNNSNSIKKQIKSPTEADDKRELKRWETITPRPANVTGGGAVTVNPNLARQGEKIRAAAAQRSSATTTRDANRPIGATGTW
jgi:hypothetical protein